MSWICLNCETENPNSLDYCEVCGLPHATTNDDIIKQKYSSDAYKAVIRYQFSLLCKADSGDPISQYLLASWFLNQKKNPNYKCEAVKWLLRSAYYCNPDAQYHLAKCYEEGYGVIINETKAVSLYRDAALNGNNSAQLKMADYYLYGRIVKKDVNEALRWFSMSDAEITDIDLLTIGNCFEEGDGINEDKEKAVEYYRKAAEKGNTTAQYKLGRCYEYGIGIGIDDTSAKLWYWKASHKNEDARKRLSAITKRECKAADKATFLVWGMTALSFIFFFLWYVHTPENSWAHENLFDFDCVDFKKGPLVVISITYAVYKIMAYITNYDDKTSYK